MVKNFTNAADKFPESVVLYGHSDNLLYEDKAHKVKVKKAVFETIPVNRLLVEKDGVVYIPVSIKVNTPDDEVVVITNSSTSASAATFKTSEK